MPNLARARGPWEHLMLDADHGVALWTSIASTFKSDPAIVFDLYDEPCLRTTNAQTSDPWDG